MFTVFLLRPGFLAYEFHATEKRRHIEKPVKFKEKRTGTEEALHSGRPPILFSSSHHVVTSPFPVSPSQHRCSRNACQRRSPAPSPNTSSSTCPSLIPPPLLPPALAAPHPLFLLDPLPAHRPPLAPPTAPPSPLPSSPLAQCTQRQHKESHPYLDLRLLNTVNLHLHITDASACISLAPSLPQYFLARLNALSIAQSDPLPFHRKSSAPHPPTHP
ncbi:hypothetical protein B0H13DRAFT_2321309 [Mycena leptocephala]|nr:hypothetical protein B0H13DRAFT_2321309 [Mycena leptocephala]